MDFLKRLKAMEKRTCVLVTHDVEEAIALADRIVILSDKPSKVKKAMDNLYVYNQSKENEIYMKNEIESVLMD